MLPYADIPTALRALGAFKWLRPHDQLNFVDRQKENAVLHAKKYDPYGFVTDELFKSRSPPPPRLLPTSREMVAVPTTFVTFATFVTLSRVLTAAALQRSITPSTLPGGE